MNGRRVAIPGSEVQHGTGARWSSAPNDQQITVTIYLRRKTRKFSEGAVKEELLSGEFQPISREGAAEELGARAEDLHAVRTFAEYYCLCVADENAATRTVRVEGTVQQLASAFQVDIGELESVSGSYISYQGAITVPASLEGAIVAVLGLDQRPIARGA